MTIRIGDELADAGGEICWKVSLRVIIIGDGIGRVVVKEDCWMLKTDGVTRGGSKGEDGNEVERDKPPMLISMSSSGPTKTTSMKDRLFFIEAYGDGRLKTERSFPFTLLLVV